MEDKYLINVAKKRNHDDEYGIHFCTIDVKETFESEAEKKFFFIKELFGDEYNVTMTHWVCRGQSKDEWN